MIEMKVREFSPEDAEKVRAMYDSMQLGYPMPDLSMPLFKAKVVEADNGEIVGAGAIKVIGESFLWLGGVGRYRQTRIWRKLAAEARVTAKTMGLDELSAWIPPEIESKFFRSLLHCGWKPSPWRAWSTQL